MQRYYERHNNSTEKGREEQKAQAKLGSENPDFVKQLKMKFVFSVPYEINFVSMEKTTGRIKFNILEAWLRKMPLLFRGRNRGIFFLEKSAKYIRYMAPASEWRVEVNIASFRGLSSGNHHLEGKQVLLFLRII